jgi:hypothetical protein
MVAKPKLIANTGSGHDPTASGEETPACDRCGACVPVGYWNDPTSPPAKHSELKSENYGAGTTAVWRLSSFAARLRRRWLSPFPRLPPFFLGLTMATTVSAIMAIINADSMAVSAESFTGRRGIAGTATPADYGSAASHGVHGNQCWKGHDGRRCPRLDCYRCGCAGEPGARLADYQRL